jgi:two-component system NtrC family sensor kinase
MTTRLRPPPQLSHLSSVPSANALAPTPTIGERDPREDGDAPSGELRAAPRTETGDSGVAPARKPRRHNTGRRLPLERGTGLEEFLRLAGLLPVDQGLEAVARAVCDLVRALRPSCAVGVVLPGEGAAGDPLYVVVAPLLPSIEPVTSQALGTPLPGQLAPRDTDPNRLFPGIEDEWIVPLAAPFEGVSLHVAGSAGEAEGDAASALQELVERAAVLLASGLRGAERLRATRGESTQLRELQARIVQSEKLASVGQIAAKVVHELNNPLTAIVSYADFLTKKLGRAQHDPGDIERLRRIGESAERILQFSRDLTTYASPRDEPLASIALRDVLERAVLFCEHVASEHHVTVEVDIDDAAPRIVGRRGQLTQVFVNLLTNACHAVHDAGRGDGGKVVIVLHPRDGGGACVSVGDNGDGISPQNLVRVFDPFFTTKAEGRGTGLGLSIVRSIVEEHGGRVWARSVVGTGTQFIVELVRTP